MRQIASEIKNRFRPLSENYISQSGIRTEKRDEFQRFPSPVGELHFSIRPSSLIRKLRTFGKIGSFSSSVMFMSTVWMATTCSCTMVVLTALVMALSRMVTIATMWIRMFTKLSSLARVRISLTSRSSLTSNFNLPLFLIAG